MSRLSGPAGFVSLCVSLVVFAACGGAPTSDMPGESVASASAIAPATVFEPCAATGGAVITIKGSGFRNPQGTSTLTIRGNAMTVTRWSDTTIDAILPKNVSAGPQPVVVSILGVARALGDFTVLPGIATVAPDMGPPGTLVTLTGQNFGTSQGKSVIKVQGVTPVVQSWTGTKIIVAVPASIPDGVAKIVATVGGQPTNESKFTVLRGSTATRTIVSLTFDDTFADQLDAVPLMDAHGMHGTFYVNSTRIGAYASGQYDYMTRDQLLDLQADGHEIGGHTLHHVDLTSLDNDELLRQLCDDRSKLLAMGMNVTSLAYPFGKSNAAVRLAVAQCGFNSARITNHSGGVPFPVAVPPAEHYAVPAAPSIRDTTSLEQLQGYVTDAEDAGGGWVPIVMHHVCTDCGSASAISVEIFGAFVDWLALRAGQGTVVRTMAEVVGGVQKVPVAVPAATPITSVRNGSFEVDTQGDGAPDCWVLGVPGGSTAQWSRTNEAHAGSWAMRLDEPTGAASDRRVIGLQDSGSCSIKVTVGATYAMSAWYQATTVARLTAYTRDTTGFWQYWATSQDLPATAGWSQVTWTMPAVPAGTTAVSIGALLPLAGTLLVDDVGFGPQ